MMIRNGLGLAPFVAPPLMAGYKNCGGGMSTQIGLTCPGGDSPEAIAARDASAQGDAQIVADNLNAADAQRTVSGDFVKGLAISFSNLPISLIDTPFYVLTHGRDSGAADPRTGGTIQTPVPTLIGMMVPSAVLVWVLVSMISKGK